MEIEHVALYVNDLEAARDFFVKYFEAKSGEKYNNFNTGFSCYFLTFKSGSRLEIMNRSNMDNLPKGTYRTGFHHIAIAVDDEKAVQELTDRISNDGYHVVKGPRRTGDKYYESVVADFEGNEIEIIAKPK